MDLLISHLHLCRNQSEYLKKSVWMHQWANKTDKDARGNKSFDNRSFDISGALEINKERCYPNGQYCKYRKRSPTSFVVSKI